MRNDFITVEDLNKLADITAKAAKKGIEELATLDVTDANFKQLFETTLACLSGNARVLTTLDAYTAAMKKEHQDKGEN